MPDGLIDLLPETFEGRDKIGEKFPSVEALANAYRELENKHNGRAYLPDENASPEAWAEFNRRLGVPPSAAEYKAPAESSEEFSSLLDGIKDSALKLGISTKQWEGLTAEAKRVSDEQVAARVEEVKAAREEWQRAAREKYGDKFAEKAAMGQRWLDKVSEESPEFGKVLEMTGTMDHPEFLDFAIRAGETTGHGRTPGPLGGGERQMAELDVGKHVAGMVKLNMEKAELASHNPHDPRLVAMQNKFAEQMKELIEAGYEGGLQDPKVLPFVNPAAAMEREIAHNDALREQNQLLANSESGG